MMHLVRRLLGRFAPVGLLLAVLGGLVLKTGEDAEILWGTDSGFELYKAQVLAERPGEARRMWNDQPWLHTLLVATLFRAGGGVTEARVLTILSVAALYAALTLLWRASGGRAEVCG